MRLEGCIFVDTPKECRHIDIGKCLGVERLSCVFSHPHLKIADDAKDGLVEAFRAELDSKSRYKTLSGLAGSWVSSTLMTGAKRGRHG